MTPVRQTVANTIGQILADKGTQIGQIEDHDTLTGSLGLDSLDLAVLVVKLEQELGADPFRDGLAPVPTFGKLVELYEGVRGEGVRGEG